MVIVKLGADGKISLFTPVGADVVIDVLGWFPATGSFTGVVPARLMDTRGRSPASGGPPPGALTPGTSWQWQIDGNTIDETVLDGVTNPKKMYDIDLFATDASTIQRLHAKGIYVVCYVETGSWENYRPDAGAYPASVLGNTLGGFPNERLVDIRQIAVLQPIIAARFDIAKAKGCDGIEPDLDDTYNGYNTGFPLTMQHQLAFNKAVADLAHARGMSIGLKNGASRRCLRAGDGAVHRLGAERGVQPVRRVRRLPGVHRRQQGRLPGGVHGVGHHRSPDLSRRQRRQLRRDS